MTLYAALILKTQPYNCFKKFFHVLQRDKKWCNNCPMITRVWLCDENKEFNLKIRIACIRETGNNLSKGLAKPTIK